ncbi:hypothetical protein AZH11_06870 [Pseudomonas simiae]|nr:hypothetical protein AZH11_06870 [Pseudomonas simiae]
MTTLQSIDCQWILPDGSLAPLGKQNGVSGGRVVFTISPQIMAASVGKRITVRYLVTTGTKTISSQTQTLTVETIAAEHFPQALINGIADKGVVKMAGFTGNATLTLSNWPFSVEGQKVWITAHSAGIEQLPVLTAYKVTPADVTKGLVNIPVSRAWLERLGTNSTVRLAVAVTLDRSDIQENAIAFKSTTYTVLAQFRIAQEPMELNGLSIKVPNWARTGRESVGNTDTRVAINGTGTLTYTSRNAGVASVSPHGVVTGNGWGSTIIDVKDQAGNAVQYPVNVSNVYSLAINETLTAFPAAQTWINTGRPLGFDGISDLQRVYGSRCR